MGIPQFGAHLNHSLSNHREKGNVHVENKKKARGLYKCFATNHGELGQRLGKSDHYVNNVPTGVQSRIKVIKNSILRIPFGKKSRAGKR